MQGFLLQYYARGTLLQCIELSGAQHGHRWALQIAASLKGLHDNGITHMDLKLLNVVISADNDAVLIDISGIGGVTFDWLSPEM